MEKSGVIERSLSQWASPVIVVTKKSAPDEPLRRRLCIDYRKVQCVAARSEADRQRHGVFITLSITKNRQNVFQTGRCNNFLYHRFTFRLLPHRPYTRVKSQVSICSTHGKVAVQNVHCLDSVRLQPISSC